MQPPSMPTYPPPSGDPYARGSVLHGFRAAVVDLWGDSALAQVAEHLPLGTRIATIDQLVLPFEWVAIGHVVAWHDALWAGPLQADEQRLARLIARSIELGFGRFKSAFFSGVTTERLVDRAQELWRYQHTHGEVTVTIDTGSTVVELRDHPYVGHAVSRRVTAESYRHIVTMALAQDEALRGRSVRAAWGMQARGSAGEASSLVVQLSW
jgi:hypothetical protein